MKPGIFAKTFRRSSVEHTFDAVRSHELGVVQFNMVCAGLPSMPDKIPPPTTARIRRAAADRSVEMAAVSGTYNMIHPNPEERADGLRRLRVLAAGCTSMGVSVVTLCTGTRDPHDPWRRHPDNDTSAAWRDLCTAMEQALDIAEEHDIVLAFEPEVANVADSARKGRQLLDIMASQRLRVVFDPANLFVEATVEEQRRLVEEGLDLLGEFTVIAHAKDRTADGTFCPAGQGVLDYPFFVQSLRRVHFDGPLVLHGLQEEETPMCVRFLRDLLARHEP